MRALLALLALLLAALPARPTIAQEFGSLVAQVALQPLPEGQSPDIESFLRANWKAYYNAGGQYGFFRDQVRAGRIDLNEDGRSELFILIDSPAWTSAKGQPMLVATWTSQGWKAIGWTFGESDGVFVTSQRVDGWASIETPSQGLRWKGDSYQSVDKPRK